MRDAVEDKMFDFSPSLNNQSHHNRNTVFRARPKLAAAHAVLSSKLEEPTGTQINACEETEDTKPEPLEYVCVDPPPIPVGEMTKDEDVEEQRVKERENPVEKGSKVALDAATRKSLWRGEMALKQRRERLGGGLESIDESNEGELNNKRVHRKKSWGVKQRNAQTSRDGDHCMQGSMKMRDGEEELVPHSVLTRVLLHSSASSSSSFNNSSAESDEVFSESEDTAARRQTMKKVSGILGKLRKHKISQDYLNWCQVQSELWTN